MDSSIYPRASSDKRRGAVLWSAILAAPIVWLMALQVNYVLAYPTCADRSNGWIHVTNGVLLVVMLTLCGAAGVAWRAYRRHQPRHFLSVLGIFMAGLFLILAIGLAVPPLVLRPCD